MNLTAKLMVLLLQILFNLTIATTDDGILMWMSAEHVPLLNRVAPRWLKLVTSSTFWPFMLISALIGFVGDNLALFCADFHRYGLALSTNLLVSSSTILLLPPIRSVSPANRGLHIGLSPVVMNVCWSQERPAESSLGTSGTGWVTVSTAPRHLLTITAKYSAYPAKTVGAEYFAVMV